MDGREDWLAEIEFPAMKTDLIDAAVDHEAPQGVIERLQRLSQEQYESRAELEEELEQDPDD